MCIEKAWNNKTECIYFLLSTSKYVVDPCLSHDTMRLGQHCQLTKITRTLDYLVIENK